MTDITPPVNEPIAVADEVLRGFLDLGVVALEAALAAWAPWTSLPVVKQIIDAGIGWVEGIFYKALAEDTSYLIYKFESFVEKTNYLQSVSDLKAAQLSGDPLLLTAAQKAFANATSALIRNDGVVKP